MKTWIKFATKRWALGLMAMCVMLACMASEAKALTPEEQMDADKVSMLLEKGDAEDQGTFAYEAVMESASFRAHCIGPDWHSHGGSSSNPAAGMVNHSEAVNEQGLGDGHHTAGGVNGGSGQYGAGMSHESMGDYYKQLGMTSWANTEYTAAGVHYVAGFVEYRAAKYHYEDAVVHAVAAIGSIYSQGSFKDFLNNQGCHDLD
jgi:hypothetical protein